MPQDDKNSRTPNQKPQTRPVEKGYQEKGVSRQTAEAHAWAAVTKLTSGVKKKGNSAGKTTLILLGIVALLAGCETNYRRAASVDPLFPPAPPNPLNSPGTEAR